MSTPELTRISTILEKYESVILSEWLKTRPSAGMIRTGSIRIEAGEARTFAASGEVAPGNYVYIEVRDTGRGVRYRAQL